MSLTVLGLTCTLPNGRVLFQDLNLHVAQGEALMIRGPSGTGKTKLLRLLAQLDAPEKGSFILNGTETPEKLGIPAWRINVLYVAQDAPLLPGTPADFFKQITSFKGQKGRSLGNPIAIASQWFLSADKFDERWTDLSGGERQRANLAIAVALRPKVLLLDEVCSSLDPEATLAIEETLLSGQFTTVWVSHNQIQVERIKCVHVNLKDFLPIHDNKGLSDESVTIA